MPMQKLVIKNIGQILSGKLVDRTLLSVHTRLQMQQVPRSTRLQQVA